MFKRTTTTDTADAAATSAGDADEPSRTGSAPKGRATPKRNVAQARTRTTVVTQGGGKRGRPSREQVAERRAAFRRGDESALPLRDRGPVRRFVRDYVDSRRSVIGLFIPAALLILALSRVGMLGALLQVVFVIAVVFETTLMSRRIRSQVRKRFPGESTKGLGYYAFSRAMMFRRWRMPTPRVERGAKI